MQPNDWVADCMVPDAWLHQPFAIGKDAVACDGRALVAFPGEGKSYAPPVFEGEHDPTEQIKTILHFAREAVTGPVNSIKDLGLSDEHAARLSAVECLQVEQQSDRIIFHNIVSETGELGAYGVIFKGAQAQSN